ncbi:MAG: phospho-sugar mutase [Mycoplasma sp.]
MKTENKIFNEWMKSIDVPQTIKEQMKEMTAEDIEASFSENPIKFGTAGYRAKTGPGPLFLNEITYKQLTVAYAQWLLKTNEGNKTQIKVLVAHDNRENGADIARYIAKILTAFKIKVYLAPNNTVLATPTVSFIVRNKKLNGAINITASHNPKEYNGFKVFNKTGSQLSDTESKEVESLIKNISISMNQSFTPNKDLINFIPMSAIEDYFSDITKTLSFNDVKPTNSPIVLTPHHGACCLYFRKYLKKQGINIIPVTSQFEVDSNFTNSECYNPEDPKSFEKALEVANQVKSDIMLGIDPDGDRVAVAIKHKGEWKYLNGNQTGILATYYLLKYKECHAKVPVVISTYVSNSLINEIVNDHNGLVIRTGTGFKNIALAMNHTENSDSEFMVGFEEAVGMCVSDSIREKDAMASAALIIQMYNHYKEINLSLVDVLETQIYQRYGFWYGETVSIEIPGNNWKDKAAKLEEKALKQKVGKFCGLDITEVFWNEAGGCIEWKLSGDAWIKFRISGTEPKFKIYYNLFFSPNTSPFYQEKEYQLVLKTLTEEIKKTFLK